MEKFSKAIKRFGARYGKRVRSRLAAVETVSKSLHKCPYCNYLSVKKMFSGAFSCKRCSAVFTGRAYEPLKTKSTKAIAGKDITFTGELFTKKEKDVQEDDELALEAQKTLKNLRQVPEEPSQEELVDDEVR